ncbi:MAG: hypothetical protein P8J93_03755 [SAR86 cluster bacterium]|nr:hypothetical protein [SAR86 cluster bacterium]|tara:strand:- start:9341 stop:9643 length:303 start_codon:yes stop_codon:yes gene_type:complete
MKKFLRYFALFCIWTTPFQVVLVFWGTWIVLTTDFSLLSLSQIEFIDNYLNFLKVIINWLYVWIWNPYLDFILSLPLILTQTFRAIFSTWLGFWILKKLK